MTTETSESSAPEVHTWFSFDLDYTLIRYKESLHQLIFDSAVRYLVEEKDYPKSLLEEPYSAWRKYVAKGLIIDEKKGNVFQLDKSRHVMRAMRGTMELTKAEIKKIYPKPISFSGLSEPGTFFSLTTGFEMPLGAVFPLLVTALGLDKKEDVTEEEFQRINSHLRDSLNFNFLNWEGVGYFFPELRKNPLEYITKRDDVREWLKHLKTNKNHRLMLMTNSMPQYTELLMVNAFGSEWKGLFDIILVKAAKPFFFSPEAKNKPRIFQEYDWKDGYKVSAESAPLRLGGCFAEGNSALLIDFLNSEVHAGEKFNVLYFGDHMVGDVKAPRLANWKTVAVVEELEHQELHGVSWVHSRTIAAKRSSPIVRAAQGEHWAPYLTGSEGATFWGQWAQTHADVIVPCLTDLKDEDLSTVFVEKKQTKCVIS